MRRTWLSALATILLLGGTAAAQVPPADPTEDPNAAVSDAMEFGGMVGGDVGLGMIGEDLVLRLNLGTEFTFWKFGLGIQAPLNLVVWDQDPEEDLIGGVIRKRDWDEPSDFLKILRYLRFGQKGELVYVLIGDLRNVYIGHGTIVGHYYNNTHIDHFRLGLQADLNTDYGGFETIFSHLNTDAAPGVAGGRIYIKPFAFWDKESYANNFAVGFSYVGDFKAPYQLRDTFCNITEEAGFARDVDLDGDGTPDFTCTEGQYTPNGQPDGYWDSDDEGNIRVLDRDRAMIFGFDLEFKVLDLSWIELTPYFDFNKIISADYGVHLGVLNIFKLPLDIGLQLRVEYRYFAENYVPTYFDATYEGYKFLYPFETSDGQGALPKLYAVEEGYAGKARHGYYGELSFWVSDWVRVGGIWEDYQGEYNSNLSLSLELPALEVVEFYAMYYKRNFEGADEIFTLDDKSLLLAAIRVPFATIFYAQAAYRAVWEYDPSESEYERVDDWSVGIGIGYRW